MKNYISYICGVLLIFAPLAVKAQTKVPKLADNSIAVNNLTVEKANKTLLVNLDLNMDSLDIPSNTRYVFTPVVRNNTYERLMPQIVVNGRKQDISYKRHGYKDFSSSTIVVRRKNDTEQTVHYSAMLPYEKWMDNCNVLISEDLCGCGDVLDSSYVELKRLRTPFMPYLRPAAEAQKVRH